MEAIFTKRHQPHNHYSLHLQTHICKEILHREEQRACIQISLIQKTASHVHKIWIDTGK